MSYVRNKQKNKQHRITLKIKLQRLKIKLQRLKIKLQRLKIILQRLLFKREYMIHDRYVFDKLLFQVTFLFGASKDKIDRDNAMYKCVCMHVKEQ